MMAFLLSFLLLFTIVVAFVTGIALGYYAVCGILHYFDPSRLAERRTASAVLAPTPSGD